MRPVLLRYVQQKKKKKKAADGVVSVTIADAFKSFFSTVVQSILVLTVVNVEFQSTHAKTVELIGQSVDLRCDHLHV